MVPTDEEATQRLLDDPYAFPYVRWYDRQGNRISLRQGDALLGDQEARRVGLTNVGPYVVSTVFLVLDHRYDDGPPVLFETMVFARDEFEDPDREGLQDFDSRRYCTEAEAAAGHEETVTLVRATTREEL